MPLFEVKDNSLSYINEIPFPLERDIQKLCESNLGTILGYKFIRSEFSVESFRIDTLSYDEKSSSFIIIEYKRDKSFSVIDQGYAYLSLMLNHKSDFIIEYYESTGKNLKRNDVDWSQSKVIFVSPSFTDYQKEAIGFKDLPIELWEIKQYSNKTISFNQIQTKGSLESITTVSKDVNNIEMVTREVKVYTEDEHLGYGSDEIKELYDKIKTMILNIADDISVKPTKVYIGFITKTNICDIAIQKKSLKIWLNAPWGEVDDLRKLARDVTSIGHHGNGAYEIQISDENELEYVISLVRQVYNKSKLN